ncbi:MAG: hypothetical protein R2770_20075 [Acidimicrobiales bacterium]
MPGEPGWDELVALFEPRGAVRSIIVADIDRTSTSCGFAVPYMDFVSERDTLADWGEARTDDEIAQYWATKNAVSIDGLPALS